MLSLIQYSKGKKDPMVCSPLSNYLSWCTGGYGIDAEAAAVHLGTTG